MSTANDQPARHDGSARRVTDPESAPGRDRSAPAERPGVGIDHLTVVPANARKPPDARTRRSRP